MKTYGNFNKNDIISIFLPDTYEVYWDTSPKEFINKMEKEYRRFWNDQRKKKLEKGGKLPTMKTYNKFFHQPQRITLVLLCVTQRKPCILFSNFSKEELTGRESNFRQSESNLRDMIGPVGR